MTGRGCAWCDLQATGRARNGWPACEQHGREYDALDDAVRESGRVVAELQAEADREDRSDQRRLSAYADALRGVAAAAVIARRTPYNMHALQTMLNDVEHHLSTLIVLGFVPGDTGRPVTSSAPLDPRDPRAELP